MSCKWRLCVETNSPRIGQIKLRRRETFHSLLIRNDRDEKWILLDNRRCSIQWLDSDEHSRHQPKPKSVRSHRSGEILYQIMHPKLKVKHWSIERGSLFDKNVQLKYDVTTSTISFRPVANISLNSGSLSRRKNHHWPSNY